MPNTLLIETDGNDQCFTFHHQLLQLSMLMLLLAPWAIIIAISLISLHIVTASPLVLLLCMAVVIAAIPGLLHFNSPDQQHQDMPKKTC